LNQAMHTGPVVLVLIELLTVAKLFPSATIAIMANLSFSAVYTAWVIWVHHISGVWAYPILGLFNLYQRAAFFGGCAIAILCCYFLGDLICKQRWGCQEGGKAGPGKGAKAGKGKRKTK